MALEAAGFHQNPSILGMPKGGRGVMALGVYQRYTQPVYCLGQSAGKGRKVAITNHRSLVNEAHL